MVFEIAVMPESCSDCSLIAHIYKWDVGIWFGHLVAGIDCNLLTTNSSWTLDGITVNM